MLLKLKIWILFGGILQVACHHANGQEVMKVSLAEAQQYALQHNHDIRNARTDIEIARKKVAETTAIGLPQVTASVGYNNFLNIPTQLIPDFLTPAVVGVNEDIFGLTPLEPVSYDSRFFEAQFGVQHNLTAGVTVSQLLFSGPYLVGLQAARAFVELSESALQKSEIAIKTQVAKAFYPVLVLQENKVIIDSMLVSLRTMLYEAKEIFGQGFIGDTDVDQLQLLVSDMETNLLNTNNRLELAFNYLKLLMGLDTDVRLEITDDLQGLISEISKEYLADVTFDLNSNINYRIVKNQETLANLDFKRNRSEYLPSLSAFYSLQETGMRDKFDYFESGKDWYRNQVLGFQLDIPIFSSGSRKNKVQQAKLTLDKVKTIDEQITRSLRMAEKSARIEFDNAWLVYRNKESNMYLASGIYQKTQIRYREGLASSLELSQTHNQFMQSEMEYLMAMLDMLNRKTELDEILSRSVR